MVRLLLPPKNTLHPLAGSSGLLFNDNVARMSSVDTTQKEAACQPYDECSASEAAELRAIRGFLPGMLKIKSEVDVPRHQAGGSASTAHLPQESSPKTTGRTACRAAALSLRLGQRSVDEDHQLFHHCSYLVFPRKYSLATDFRCPEYEPVRARR